MAQWKEENYQPIYLMNMEPKILHEIPANQIQYHSEKIIHNDLMGFVTRYKDFGILKSVDMIQHRTVAAACQLL
jgi:hypothetical protein